MNVATSWRNKTIPPNPQKRNPLAVMTLKTWWLAVFAEPLLHLHLPAIAAGTIALTNLALAGFLAGHAVSGTPLDRTSCGRYFAAHNFMKFMAPVVLILR